MKTLQFEVAKPAELLSFLLEKMSGASRSHVKDLLAHAVRVDGRKVSQFNYLLQPGMLVTVEQAVYKERFRPQGLDIVYEDEYLFVINKHEGLLSYSKNFGDPTVITSLNRYLEATHQKSHAHIVHRLDRDTSGLMLVSKSKGVSRTFESDWKRYVYDRAYVAVAWGRVEPSQGSITSWLTDGPYCVLSSPTDNGGKKAVTHYVVKQATHRYSLLELSLETGRRNQIRVHLREMKHPVVHDPMYGFKDDTSPIQRLALHAFRLCFVHPITCKRLEFSTPYPSSFLKLMEL